MENTEKYRALMEDATTDESAFERLWEIVNILREECPWDRQQTYESLRSCMLEEAYEAVDAVNRSDTENLREELGDVFLQVLMNAKIAEQNDDFLLKDVINEECDKMIRRHPHIFSQETIKTVDKVLEKWENIKRKEKGRQTRTISLMNVPRALPSLTRSYKIQKKAAEVGFDWDDVSEAFLKIEEEMDELKESYVQHSREDMREELGDLLFSIVNVARFLKIDPEEALNLSSDKFLRRFQYIEESALKKGHSLNDMTLEQMDKLWEEAKVLERT
ncbi:MAG: nucleoside triphosphate pyrophosphohydrolase [Eubacteriales bacterium]|nr:nucleoside triphosphate pyrophosphohydrolase [Eubacteriales bacterium]MDD4389247.1 nucleoside triphosphate pyrophosphohydrolase [Eubacteriales bacterium]